MDPNATPTLGLDISKSKVDCVLRLQNEKCKSKVIANSEAGFHTLGAWLAKQKVEQVHACCEATGTYWEALAQWLADHGHKVSVVNPARIAAYAKAHNHARAKTDKVDARLIATFCAREQPPLWTPQPVEERVLLALLRRLHDLEQVRQAEANRLGVAHPSVRPTIEQHLHFLNQQTAQLKKTIEDHIDRNDNLRGRRDLLDSIPGLGEATIPWLLAYLGDGQRFERSKQAVAFAGMAPKVHQSGTLNRKAHIDKSGHADLRYVLYMPAVAAYRCCKAYAPFVQRLKAAGKPPKVIIVALMRKLLAIAQAVLKSGQPFNPELHRA
jgi:transposase